MNGSDQQQSQQQSAPKSFMQQFLDLQKLVISHEDSMGSIEQGFALTGAALKGALEEQKLLSDQLQAIYVLAEAGEKISRAAVAQKVQDLRLDEAKKKLETDLKADLIRPIEMVKDNDSIVVYEDYERKTMFAYNPLAAFKDEVKKELLGKKTGDSVGSMKILGVYEVNQEALQKAEPNVQAN